MSIFGRPRVIRSEVEGRRDQQRERAYQERYARRHGYYWLPCGLCGEWHGGHEAGGTLPRPDEGDGIGRFTGICPRCTAERQEAAERELRKLGRSVEWQTSRWGMAGVMHHRVGDRPTGSRQDSFYVEAAAQGGDQGP